MSEELIKSLNARLTEVEKDKLNLQIALREERKAVKTLKGDLETANGKAEPELKDLRKQVADLTTERDGLASKVNAAPGEKDARITELETTLRTRDHRDAFLSHVGKELAEGVSVEDLWHFGKFDPSAVESLDEKQITDLVSALRESKPILFVAPDASGHEVAPNGASQKAKAQLPSLKTGTDASRGARDNSSSRVKVRMSDLHDPDFGRKNKDLLAGIGRTVDLIEG